MPQRQYDEIIIVPPSKEITLSKREYFAAMALQGLLSNPEIVSLIMFQDGNIDIAPTGVLRSQISDLAVIMAESLTRSIIDYEDELDKEIKS